MLTHDNAPAFDSIIAGKDEGDGFGVETVFFAQDAGREGVGGILIEDGDACLGDDGAGVESFIDEVHGAAGDFCAMDEGLMLRVKAGKRGEQRRMDV